MSRVHFTRNWKHIICNSTIDCKGRAIVSDPRLLAQFSRHNCANCIQMLTANERAVMAQRAAELGEFAAPSRVARKEAEGTE